ncbi:EPIDERMAL PATTERNING FACTOR-like protein 4 isoform X2 [Nicotiana tomentosiformis]|uniref:EPIDERMAL PATTERNING FACTOR-like protein 4 isoform X2 n=1 Tax=Nicotiana tomentosiformis TaxID=4098 RepID=UPI00051B3E9B|nr:EPIDERMAL PATTERNING FACTOR-like protein 4 isoform X2 [Nicotiana tomentosiformis]
MSVLRHHISSSLSFATIVLITLTFLLLSSALGLHPARNLKLTERVLLSTQQRLRGPGSSPPTCRSKCGRCSPCKPVRVSVQPGFTSTLEYYPEAWRCKCRNKLFMP